MTIIKTAVPLLVSITEAAFQLSLPKEDVLSLISDGELTSVAIRGQVLIPYESLRLIARRAKRELKVGRTNHGETSKTGRGGSICADVRRGGEGQ